ncbi:HTH_38 domain-containing protein [Trichonephila clavipes]|nr:HTH_38 domain-containing protein [Trichonephila clavipes]
MEIVRRVARNQATVTRICDRWIQEGTTDRRDRSQPPQCITSREDRQFVRMTVMDRSVTLRTIAQRACNTSFSVCAYHSTPFTAEWSVRKTSIAWSTLDAEPHTSTPPMVQ